MKEKRYERCIETLSQMIQIATVSRSDDAPTDFVVEFHSYVKERFPKISSKCEKIDEFDGGLMFKLKGKNSSLKPLVLMSHFDVAQVSDNWIKPPFGGEIADGKIYGRGAADTKSSLCAFLEAVENLLNDGYMPESDLYLLSSSREEIGGKDARLMKDYFVKQGIIPALLIDEGGAILEKPMDFINGKYAMIAMSERSAATVSIKGTESDLLKFEKKASKFSFVKNEFPAEVEEMFSRMVPAMNAPMNTVFKHLKLTKGLLCKIMPKISREAGAMVAPSISFSTNENNVRICKVACTYHHEVEKITEKIVDMATNYNIEAEVKELRSAPPPTDFNHAGVKLVEKTVTEVFEKTTPTPFIIFGGTDARHFVGVSDCVVRFAPLIMTNEIISTVHNDNEYIFTQSVVKAVEFYEGLIRNFDTYKR